MVHEVLNVLKVVMVFILTKIWIFLERRDLKTKHIFSVCAENGASEEKSEFISIIYFSLRPNWNNIIDLGPYLYLKHF